MEKKKKKKEKKRTKQKRQITQHPVPASSSSSPKAPHIADQPQNLSSSEHGFLALQLQESLLVVAGDHAPASLALEVLEALRAAEPGRIEDVCISKR